MYCTHPRVNQCFNICGVIIQYTDHTVFPVKNALKTNFIYCVQFLLWHRFYGCAFFIEILLCVSNPIQVALHCVPSFQLVLTYSMKKFEGASIYLMAIFAVLKWVKSWLHLQLNCFHNAHATFSTVYFKGRPNIDRLVYCKRFWTS